METYDVTGNPISTSVQGFDYRGCWWNPNTNQLEGNGYNNLGIWVQDLDASYYPIASGTNVVPSTSSPAVQSCGDYDYADDEILYYDAGNIYRHARATNLLQSTAAITGLPVATSALNTTSACYTGIVGSEVGVYDYVNKKFYFINKQTGAFVSECQLPMTAPGADYQKVGMENGLLFVYDGVDTWYGYRVIQLCAETTNSILAVECESYTAPSGAVYTSSGIYTDIIPNAEGCDSIINIALTIDTLDLSVSLNAEELSSNQPGAQYQWVDCENNMQAINGETNQTYSPLVEGNYAVIVNNGQCSDTSACTFVDLSSLEELGLTIDIYPNPSSSQVTITGLTDNSISGIHLLNLLGERVLSVSEIKQEVTLDIDELSNGVYLIEIVKGDSKSTYRIVKN